MLEKYGIIDIGSNTIRFVVYSHEKVGRFKEIENVKSVARLRNYIDEGQNLTNQGMEVLILTLRYFEELIAYHSISNLRVVATAAIRNANNQHEIIETIHMKTNLKVRVLSDYEEAYYGFLAVINSTSINEGITIDIGGGSTEVTYFKDRKLVNYYSFPFGVLSLKKQFIAGNIPTEDELSKLIAYVTKELQTLDWLLDRKIPIIAIGGSARNVAQMDQNMKLYPLGGLHQYEMKAVDLSNVRDLVTSLPFEQLKKVDGLTEDRADIIIPAIEVFRKIYESSKASSFILSRKGLRDGVFFEELLKPLGTTMFPNVLEESLNELENEYEINIQQAFQAARIAISILKQMKEIGFRSFSDKHITDLKRAAQFYQLGSYIDSEASSQHTFYLIANRTIDGLMHRERLRLAAIASFKSKVNLNQYLDLFQQWFSKDELKEIRFFGALLRLSYALNVTKRNVVDQIIISKMNGKFLFEVFCLENWQAEQYEAERQKKHLEKTLKKSIALQFQKSF